MGKTPTILLIPGNMCDRRIWDGILPFLSNWNVVHCEPREDTITGMARKCLEENAGPLLPIGFSMGANVALAMAQEAPDRITALALLDVNAGPDRAFRAQPRRDQQHRVTNGGLVEVVTRELEPHYFSTENQGDPNLGRLVRDMADALGPEVFVAQSEALRTRRDYRPLLQAIGIPVFLACGEEDTLCPAQEHEQLAAMIPDSSLHVIPNAGHMLPLEQPERLGRHLAEWLVEVERTTLCLTES